MNRRSFMQGVVGFGAGVLGLRAAGARAQEPEHHDAPEPSSRVVPVETLDVAKLPWELDDGVKVFRLVAEHVRREFLPGKAFDVWGYNGSMPGPTIEVMEGDRVRILFENRLPEATTVHWHGLEVPIGMDGVPAISQPLVEPGGRFTYEFTLHQHGTFFYHSHMAMQEMMGMIGMFVIHPRAPYHPRVDKDFGIILQEWAVLPSNTIPNSLSMEFNWLTFNGKAGPDATPLVVEQGERVRIRIVNLGMDHHPIHLHGHQFYLTGTEGGRVPPSAQYPENTVLVGVAQARTIEFVAEYPGDWMLHCHLPHHMMNQMVSMVGPMAHAGHGMPTGMGMPEGMGVVRQGHALSEELGPSLGRGTGISTFDRPVSPLIGPPAPGTAHGGHAHGGGGEPDVPQARTRVPGSPQDMFMVMDDEVAKPETFGMAPGWTGAMQGMMTAVRILPPDRYEEIVRLVRAARREPARPRGGATGPEHETQQGH
jgi:FtsP/CotA-like multicopper oxidase with cupredoxin domain